MKYNNRKEVPEKYKWSLVEFFKDEDSFNKTCSDTSIKINDIGKYRNQLKDSNKMLEFLKLFMDIYSKIENIYVYSHLINDQQLGKKESLERLNKAEILSTKFDKETSFFENEILSFSKNDYDNLYVTNKELNDYKVMLDNIYRRKEHILSENEEKIISELVNTMDNYSNTSSNLINNEHDYGKVNIDGNEVTIATNNYRHLMKNSNIEIRKTVYDNFNKVLAQYSGTSSSLLNSYISYNNCLSKIRKFKNAWDEKIFDINIPNEVFEKLVNATEKNLNYLTKYNRIKKDVLSLDCIHPYDTYLDLVDSSKEYTIEEAQELILSAIKPLGENYYNKFKKIFDNRYIDYCQYKGKCSGAYSFSSIDNDSRILMSYNDTLDSVSTIIHEGGHNVHHQFVKENVLPQYREVSLFVCEVASLTNEFLLSNYLLNNGTKEEKLAGLDNIISIIISNYYGAVREGKMEQDMYNHSLNDYPITKEYMNELCIDSLKKYYGDSVEFDEYSQNSWINRSHYYMNFYLYSYAICVSVACNVAKKIIAGDKQMLDNYIQFLSTGSDVWPIDAFKILNVDLKDEETYLNTAKYFDESLDEFIRIYNS